MEKIDENSVLELYDKIKKFIDNADDEGAQFQEYMLKDKFINCLANGMYEPDEAINIAKMISKIDDMDFSRHWS